MREPLINFLIVSQTTIDLISEKADKVLESDKFLLCLISVALICAIALALFNPTAA